MDTRLILQILLAVIVVLTLVVGALIIVTLSGDAETVIVPRIAEEDDDEVENPWARQGDAAIALVERLSVKSDPGIEADNDDWTAGELVQEPEFVEEKLKIRSGEDQGWQADWWGETRYGPSFFRVRYAFVDGSVTIGPSWLVDLRSQQVVPKNVLAEVVTDPEQGVESEYFDQANQVVSAIISHRFPAGINLGGAILLYFDGREEAGDEDRVLGWTVDHSRDELFRAYFQWTDGGESIYAEFEFDFEEHALRASNLQAHEIMQVGETFEPVDRVTIMPATYDPDEAIRSRRWQGAARRQCRNPRHRDGCNALATVLDHDALVETLEWTLTTQVDSAAAFEQCQENRDCRWEPKQTEDGIYRVRYVYDLGEGEEEIAWDVHLDDERIEPVDSVSDLAYRAVRPRG